VNDTARLVMVVNIVEAFTGEPDVEVKPTLFELVCEASKPIPFIVSIAVSELRRDVDAITDGFADTIFATSTGLPELVPDNEIVETTSALNDAS